MGVENGILVGSGFENRAAHPYQEFPGVPPGFYTVRDGS